MREPEQKNTCFGIRISLVIVFTAICFAISALNAQQIRFQTLTQEDGLSQGSVNAIAQDKQGFLWFATQEGANRYDGYGFTTFRSNTDDPSSLGHNWVKTIAVAESGELVFGTLGGGISFYVPEENRFSTRSKSSGNFPVDRVLTITPAKDGGYWVGSYAGLFFIPENLRSGNHDTAIETYRRNVGELPSDTVHAVVHVDDKVWVATQKGIGLYSTSEKGWKQPLESVNPVTAIYTSDDHVLAIVDNTLCRWHKSSAELVSRQTFPDVLQNKRITATLLDATGNLWIASTSGIWITQLDPQNGEFEEASFKHLQQDPNNLASISDNYVLSLFEDASGVVWVGTRNGLSKFSPSQHKFFSYNNAPGTAVSLSNEMVFSILNDSAGRLWVGTAEGLNLSEPGKSIAFRQHRSGHLDNRVVLALLEDSRRRIWVGTNKGLKRLDATGREERVFKYSAGDPGSLPHNAVFHLHEDQQQQIWVGTAGAGLALFDEVTQRFTRVDADLNPQPSRLSIFSSLDRNDGETWFGTSEGLFVYNAGSKNLSRPDVLQPFPELHEQTIFSLYESIEGLWIGTRNGLYGISNDSDSLLTLGYEEGLPNEVVYAIIPDEYGALWLPTNRGLIRYFPQTKELDVFLTGDGLQSNEFNQGAFATDKKGNLYVGGIKGFNCFKPGSLHRNDYRPPVVLTGLNVFDQPYLSESQPHFFDHVSLSYEKNFISFEFAALDYNNPERNRYAYKLEGVDKDWVNGTRRYASYTNLDGGDYVFKVRGSNNDGVWNEVVTELNITIIPPFWKTWWAYVLYVAFILSGIYAFIVLRTRAQKRKIEQQRKEVAHLKKLDRLKDEFLANTSHELRTPLNGIIGITESLIAGAGGSLNEFQHQNLTLVASSGRRLSNLINDILDFSRLKKKEIRLRYSDINLAELTQNVFAISEPLIDRKEIVLKNLIPLESAPLRADENRVQQILQNLVGNAIKFTKSGTISVTVEPQQDGVSISVTDTGIGISPDKLETIFQSFEQADASTSREYGGTGLGLPITRKLVQLHGGDISVHSELGKGSVFSFYLPNADGKLIDEVPEPAEVLPEITHEYAATPAHLNGFAEADSANGQQAAETSTAVLNEVDSAIDFHIMIVDDEPVNIQVLKNYLQLSGYRITECDSGTEALERVYEDGIKPDLVLLDVMMPQLSGYEVCRKLREDYPSHELPIVMLTAKTQTSDLIEGFEAGANDYVTKPFDQRELFSRVNTLLTLKEAVSSQNTLAGIQQELHVARRIQESILPSENPQIDGLEVASKYIPMETVGGDFYDFHLTPEGQLGILVADVSGHGIPAAFISAMVKIAFSSQEEYAADSSQLLSQMNSTLFGKYEHNFVTASYTLIDLQQRKISHADAGHLPLLVWRKDEQKLLSMKPEGLILGWDQDVVCPEQDLELKPGDRIILYTDGIIEAQNNTGEFFETEAFPAFIKDHQDTSVEDFSNRLLEQVQEWIGVDGGFADDLTLVVVDLN